MILIFWVPRSLVIGAKGGVQLGTIPFWAFHQVINGPDQRWIELLPQSLSINQLSGFPKFLRQLFHIISLIVKQAKKIESSIKNKIY